MNRLIIASFFTLLFFTNVVQAAFISDVFQPSSTDASVRLLLQPLFGELVDKAMGTGGTGTATALNNIIKFSLVNIIVPVGGLLLLYSSYMGLSMSAMNGEIYGDKKTAYFVFVRTVIGFAMVTPAPALKGLALVNLFLMWLTLHGVGAASSEWSVVVDEITKNPVVLAVGQPPYEIFDGMLRGEICAAIYNNIISEAGDNKDFEAQKKIFTKLTGGTLDPTAIAANQLRIDILGWAKSGEKTSNGGCGTIRIATKHWDADLGTINSLVPLGSIKSINMATDKVQKEMQSQTSTTLDALHTRAAEVAKMIIDADNVVGADQPPTDSYFTLMEWFKAQQLNAAKNIAATAMKDITTEFKFAVKQEGWVTAGFYFLGLSSFQQAVNRAIAMDWITAQQVSWEGLKEQIADETYMATATNQWDNMQGYISMGHHQLKAQQVLPPAAAETPWESNVVSRLFEEAGEMLNSVAVESVRTNATPLGTAASLGSALITGGWTAIGTGAIVKGAGWASGNEKTSAMGILAMTIGIYLILAGFVLLLFCLLPSLAWGRRVLAWLTRVAVSQFAGPAWMVMHVHHAGEGMTGSASGGYMLAMQLVLTPMLDITALAFIYELMIVVPSFMNTTIMPVVMALGSGTLTLFTVFVTAVINVGIIFALVALLDRFDHEVMAFIGGRGNDLNLDHEGDKNRMLALMAFANRKMPGMSIPKNNNDDKKKEGGAEISGGGKGSTNYEDLKKTPKVPTSKLLPRDK